MKISDFKGIFKSYTFTIESIENPFGDYYTVKVKVLQGFTWTPGEHGIFKLPGKTIKGKKWRAFSVASNPKEGYILIGTRTGDQVSDFKKALINMKKGEPISVRGPFGWFKLMDDTTPIVMVAGGVGITPIRAIAKTLEKNTSRPVHIVYSSKDFHLFENDLKEVAENTPLINLQKTGGSSETKEALAGLTDQFKNGAYYYVSGSQGFIKSVSNHIKESGVSKKKIISDPFLGY